MNKGIEELLELTAECADEYYFEEGKLETLLADFRRRLSTVGCWIPCSADNPPPAETPMLVWQVSLGGLRCYPVPVWCENGWQFRHVIADFTHYMLIGEPS